MEAATARLKARNKHAVDARGVDSLAQTAVDFADLQAWRDDPDVHEGNVGKFASPLGGDANCAPKGHDVVEESLPAREAAVCAAIATVNGVGAFHLTDDVCEYKCLQNVEYLMRY